MNFKKTAEPEQPSYGYNQPRMPQNYGAYPHPQQMPHNSMDHYGYGAQKREKKGSGMGFTIFLALLTGVAIGILFCSMYIKQVGQKIKNKVIPQPKPGKKVARTPKEEIPEEMSIIEMHERYKEKTLPIMRNNGTPVDLDELHEEARAGQNYEEEEGEEEEEEDEDDN